ncbi:kinase-like protein [Ramaria rubella]|nr:kinase-like protein [Ramaria rubella]
MPLGLPTLHRRPSMESFISPTAQKIEIDLGSKSVSKSGGTIRRMRPVNQPQTRMPLPRISPLLVTHTATVNVGHKGLAWWTWTRRSLRLTMRTISLHRNPESEVLDIIVLPKVKHVERVDKQPHCLRIEAAEDKTYYFAFDQEEELYTWLTDIHLAIDSVSKPTDFMHVMRVVADKQNTSCLIGLPEAWKSTSYGPVRESITQEMVEAALPEIRFSEEPEPIIDFNDALPDSRPVSFTSLFEREPEEAIIMKAQKAIKPATQRLLKIQPDLQSLKIVTEGFSNTSVSRSGLLSASGESPSTPLLTPDTSPLTPFRESPYKYRDSDAKDLSGQVQRLGQWAEANGGFADIWRANWNSDTGSFSVAVKVLRFYSRDEAVRTKIQRRLAREVRVWHQLRHKNIVQLYGTCEGFGPFPSMVSAWHENGNVNTYLLRCPEAGTVEKRLKLLTEVACGLNYLHTFTFPVSHGTTAEANIVHGDLKGANILVNDNGEAALADFGLSVVIAAAGDSATSTFTGGSVRWMAPEVLFLSPHDASPKTCASDTYSYGSVMLEILTGEPPYKELSNDLQVLNQVMQGYKPKRPLKPVVNPGVWDLMERCWSVPASERPQMAFVLSRMEVFYCDGRNSMLSENQVGCSL